MSYNRRDEFRPNPSFNILPYLLLVLLGGILVWKLWPTAPPPEPRTVTPRGELADLEKATIALFKESLPSVVHINTSLIKRGPYNLNALKIAKGTGSGFVWDHLGHIVTNNHVISGANAAVVVMADGAQYTATLVGNDPNNDVAVLKISAPASKLRPIPIGESADLQVGQSAFAIGNPFGLSGSLTTGVVSGLGRELETHDGGTLTGLIQTDAAINPGNSGGPLLDSAGRLIGMNTAIISPSGAFAGIGFASPVEKVKSVVEGLIKNRSVSWSKAGIQEAPDQWAKAQGIKGVWVLGVRPDSPAHKAGVQPITLEEKGAEKGHCGGDIIVSVNGQPVNSVVELYAVMRDLADQPTLTLIVIRDGMTITKLLTLE